MRTPKLFNLKVLKNLRLIYALPISEVKSGESIILSFFRKYQKLFQYYNISIQSYLTVLRFICYLLRKNLLFLCGY